jgi:hypothetical protein
MADPVTFIRPGEDHWSHGTLAADGEALSDENAEALGKFETQQAFADHFFSTRNADWREPIAGEDKKFLSELQRYNAPVDLGNSWREQRQTISAGQLSKPLGDEPSDEDLAAFREANGIPAEAAGYLENLPDGLIVGEDDKEYFEDLMGALHAKNAPPAIGHAIINWYNGFAEQQQDAQAEMDDTQSGESVDKLREDWGSDYRANINLVNGLIASTFGKDAADQILNGRYQDGRAFMNDPAVLKGFAEIARKMNPIMQIDAPGTSHESTMNDEIAELEKYMREKRHEYNKDEPAQARLRDLYEIRLQHEAA